MKEIDPRVYVDLESLLKIPSSMVKTYFPVARSLQSILLGRFKSKIKGQGLMFEEIRPYHIGDNVRHIDWKISSKLRAPHVRTYLEEKDRPIYVLVDQRNSMFFGSHYKMKSVVACELASLVLTIGNKQKEKVGGIVLGNSSFKFMPASNSRKKIRRFTEILKDYNHKLPSNISASSAKAFYYFLDKLSSQLRRSKLIVIISDFYDLDERSLKILKKMSQDNNIVALLIRDKLEYKLPQIENWVCSNGEQFLRLSDRDSIYTDFKDSMALEIKEIESKLGAYNIPLVSFNTDTDIWQQIIRGIN